MRNCVLPGAGSQSAVQRRRTSSTYAVSAAANAAAWSCAVQVFRQHRVLFATAPLACGFGSRHAADADYFGAIGNVVRRRGRRCKLNANFNGLGFANIIVFIVAWVGSIAVYC